MDQKKRERAYNITPEVCCKKIPMCAYNISIFSMLNFFFFVFFEYKIVLTHTEEERRRFLKKLRVVYIQKGLTLRYTGDGRRFFKEIYSGVYPKGPNGSLTLRTSSCQKSMDSYKPWFNCTVLRTMNGSCGSHGSLLFRPMPAKIKDSTGMHFRFFSRSWTKEFVWKKKKKKKKKKTTKRGYAKLRQ